MKRTIKFRAKDIRTGEWRYGSLLTPLNKERHYMIRYIVKCEYTNTGFTDLESYVDEDTIGQFTGLHDKDGKEIYEGDIIYSEFPDGSKTNCLIGWDEEKSCFGLMDEYNYRSKLEGYDFPKFENAIFCNFRSHSKKFEVIGNIYDNPELLKGGAHENT